MYPTVPPDKAQMFQHDMGFDQTSSFLPPSQVTDGAAPHSTYQFHSQQITFWVSTKIDLQQPMTLQLHYVHAAKSPTKISIIFYTAQGILQLAKTQSFSL
jgi:hypothetical protein